MNPRQQGTQRIFPKIVDNFIRAKAAEGIKPSTIEYYRSKLSSLSARFDGLACNDISASQLRDYIIDLRSRHNQGGVHAHYRAIKALWYWFELEYEPRGWSNPMRRIKPPKVDDEILNPVTDEQLRKMLDACNRNTWHGVRDRAILLALNATGVRASELMRLRVDDVDLTISTLFVQKGKGGYPRALDFDKQTKAALRAYLQRRHYFETTDRDILFISNLGNALDNDSLRRILAARASDGNAGHITAHMFRRKHALDLYREGRTKEFIALRLGHHGTAVVDRYIKLSPQEMINRSLVYSNGDRL